ncbi:hypothetical protein OH687_30460 [Burkholderia anthina]|nr:hypothetical protein OH687_30460 [Burkholderia anthina]
MTLNAAGGGTSVACRRAASTRMVLRRSSDGKRCLKKAVRMLN